MDDGLLERLCELYWSSIFLFMLTLFLLYKLLNIELFSLVLWGKALKLQTNNIKIPSYLLISNRYFQHFYIFALICKFYFIITRFPADTFLKATMLILDGAFTSWFCSCIHLMQRLHESLRETKYSSKISIFQYIYGLSYYLFFEIAFVVQMKNHELRFSYIRIGDVNFKSVRPKLLIPFITLALFHVAIHFQARCHEILRNNKIQNGIYTLPNVGLFKYVVVPHYSMELIIILCFNIFLNFRSTSLILCLFSTFFSLSLGAEFNYEYYAKNTNFDRKIKRIIPYIF